MCLQINFIIKSCSCHETNFHDVQFSKTETVPLSTLVTNVQNGIQSTAHKSWDHFHTHPAPDPSKNTDDNIGDNLNCHRIIGCAAEQPAGHDWVWAAHSALSSSSTCCWNCVMLRAAAASGKIKILLSHNSLTTWRRRRRRRVARGDQNQQPAFHLWEPPVAALVLPGPTKGLLGTAGECIL